MAQYKFSFFSINIPEYFYTFCPYTGTSMNAVSVIFGVLRPTSASVSLNH